MIFSSKNLIPAAVFAAVASVAAVSPAQALDMFGNTGIQFDDNTSLKFTFLSADAQFFNLDLDTFGVCVVAGPVCGSETALFSPGVAPGDTATFNFSAGIEYSLFLATGKAPGYTLYSTDALNADGERFAKFDGMSLVAWEDIAPLSKSDEDYNDFIVEVTDVPTPAAVLPIIGGLLGAASKRKRDSEEA